MSGENTQECGKRHQGRSAHCVAQAEIEILRPFAVLDISQAYCRLIGPSSPTTSGIRFESLKGARSLPPVWRNTRQVELVGSDTPKSDDTTNHERNSTNSCEQRHRASERNAADKRCRRKLKRRDLSHALIKGMSSSLKGFQSLLSQPQHQLRNFFTSRVDNLNSQFFFGVQNGQTSTPTVTTTAPTNKARLWLRQQQAFAPATSHPHKIS